MASNGWRLDVWLREELPLRFENRVLSIDVAVANAWGKIVSRCQRQGRTIHAMDAFLAAATEVHKLTLVTRNVSGFEPSGESSSIPSILCQSAHEWISIRKYWTTCRRN